MMVTSLVINIGRNARATCLHLSQIKIDAFFKIQIFKIPILANTLKKKIKNQPNTQIFKERCW